MVSALADCPKCDFPDFDGICVNCGHGHWTVMGPARGKDHYVVNRNSDGVYLKPEHIVVAERALGHSLPIGAIVHHHNQNRSDNSHTNLVICEDQGYHKILHSRMNSIAQGIDPDKEKRCYGCLLIKPLNQFHRDPGNWHGRAKLCAICKNLKNTERRQRKKTTMLVGDRGVDGQEHQQNETPHPSELGSCTKHLTDTNTKGLRFNYEEPIGEASEFPDRSSARE